MGLWVWCFVCLFVVFGFGDFALYVVGCFVCVWCCVLGVVLVVDVVCYD